MDRRPAGRCAVHHHNLSAEILAGLAFMPEGRRRAALETAAHAIFADDFGGRVLLSTRRPRRPRQIFSPPAGVPAARPRRSIL